MAMPSQAEPAGPAPAQDWADQVRRGLVVIVLAVLAAGLALAFVAVNDVIAVWLEDRWVPVWRAAFAAAVVGVALWALARLTGRRLL